jgi:molybdopterin-guanine dinucleotide biosynthesis protein A
VNCSVLVLAGGRSRRFGRDKLQLDWRGVRLLDHVVNRVRELSDDVIVLASATADGYRPEPHIGVTVVADTTSWPGPLVAVADGIRHARHDHVLIVAADMPVVPIAILELLLSDIADGAEAAGLEFDGEVQPVPIAVRASIVSQELESAVQDGGRRLGQLREIADIRRIPEEQWRALDPAADSLRDVDTEADLAALLAEPA